MSEELNAFAAPRRLLVQHAPNTWGYKGLNFGFCNWLLKRKSAGDDIWLMVHEPFYPWRLRDKPTRWVLAAGQRLMLRRMLEASSRVFMSIPGWERHLRAREPRERLSMTWLPIFSTIPIVEDKSATFALREELRGNNNFLIGSFGTFGGEIGNKLLEILPVLLRRQDLVCVLLGRGGVEFAERLFEMNPELEKRVTATGGLNAVQISLYLQACDVLVQPFPDGVSSRRTSAMAGLSHGIPMVSNLGVLSEPIWGESNSVSLARTQNGSDFVAEVEMLLNNPLARANLAARARDVYTQSFALELTLNMLLDSN
jgi:glycosyltransferase involved in cell wall biosynthesis